STNHGNFWVFYVLKGSTEVGIGDSRKVLGVGEATLISERQDHSHLFPAQSEILGFHVRPSDRPPGDSHRGQLQFTSEGTIEAPAGNYSVRLREFTLARGEQTSANIGPGPFAYVMEGTLSTRSGNNIMSTTEAGKVLSLPTSGTVVVSNEGTTPLRFILVDLRPTEVVAPAAVRVVVPDPDNLQYLNFWTALGAGFFKEEGLDVQVLTPPGPPAAVQFLVQGRAEVALLPPPQYLPPIAQGQPLLIFANLLQNDPINLVVRKEVAEARKLSPTAPLAERLKGIQGLRVGVAHGPPPRLRALFSSVGMDADRDIQMVILGEERFQAFAGNPVDALYAHSPFLEKALVEQGAVVVVDQLRGEVPELAGLNIHSLVTSRAFAAANPKALVAMTRAIYRAQQLIHSDLKASASALLRSGVPGVEQRPVETTLRLYEPAVPKTPEVAITAVERTNKYFWGPRDAPEDLSAINLSDYVAPQFAQEAVGG
ncbi:MAG TPA: ABC transporter substrate-binding protein, partial [Dehalococcoidia bacterium]|nr:ABC transporter substrate-binding protein [Dehalococcoidia bacterium]